MLAYIFGCVECLTEGICDLEKGSASLDTVVVWCCQPKDLCSTSVTYLSHVQGNTHPSVLYRF